ncbi:YciI family protein [Bradyrhizobium sp. dw_411]|uniref:YciI family protein n=1 Tax=Bradyrhizobium sp. dw_411 TaxID=2720082 RepID=UPI001BCD25C3|nr:YciI family protein [Bradyrhizobium sp. dw_411]
MPEFDARTKELVSRMWSKKFWVVMSKGNGRDLVPYLAEHLDYLIALEAEGKVFASGPMNVPGSGDGMTILRVETEEEARAIANADPLVSKLGRTFTLHPWTVNEGQMTLTVSFSQMAVSLA